MKTYHFSNLAAVSKHAAQGALARQANVKLLTDAYYLELSRSITPDEIRKIRSINLAQPEDGCASSYFLDIAEVMSLAFQTCFDRIPDLGDDESGPDTSLCSDAWMRAKDLYLTGAEA
jgi:hypothetical protein